MKRPKVLHVGSKLEIFCNLIPPVVFHLASPLLQPLLGLLVLLLLPAASLINKMLFVGFMEPADDGVNLSIVLVKPVPVLPFDESESMSSNSVDTLLEDLPLFFHFTILLETAERFCIIFF